MPDRSKGRAHTKRETPWSSRLGVGREGNNLIAEEKTALFMNLIEAKTGLILWSDTGEGKD
jgi:hypothetical protein